MKKAEKHFESLGNTDAKVLHHKGKLRKKYGEPEHVLLCNEQARKSY